MRKTKVVKKTVKETVTTDILCNSCGQSCATYNWGGHWDSKKNKFIRKHNAADNDYYGLLEQEVHGGYNSTNLNDGWTYRFSLCESCLSGIMKKFKVPVEIKSEFSGGEFLPEPAHKKQMKALEKKADEIYQQHKKAEK